MKNERVHFAESDPATKELREKLSKLTKEEIIEKYLDLRESELASIVYLFDNMHKIFQKTNNESTKRRK